MILSTRLPVSPILALVLAVLFGQSLSGQTPPRNAAKLFGESCASCHGPDGSGGQTPSLLDDKWRFGGSDETVARIIRDGAPEVGMPSYRAGMSDVEIRGLVIFLREKARLASLRQDPPPKAKASMTSRLLAFHQEVLVSNLSTPWSIAFLGDREFLVTEKIGRLKRVDLRTGAIREISGLPAVRDQGQGGLLAVAVESNRGELPMVYLAYADGRDTAKGTNLGMTAVLRARLSGDLLVDPRLIFQADPQWYLPGQVHFGTRLVLDGSGHLFFSIGERGQGEDAQRLDRPNGKIHRIRLDGTVPPDNPWVGKTNALPTIYSFGHRNPQGLALRPSDGRLWSTEHGPRGGDELNLIHRGSNYGWPRVTLGMNYNGTPMNAQTGLPGMVDPVYHWTPSIAVCAMAFYTGAAFPKWRGHLFVTALAQQELRRLVLEGDRVVEEEVLWKGGGRVREVAVGPDGFLYLALNTPDVVVRLVPGE